jgi:multiple sugar transport system permease protein
MIWTLMARTGYEDGRIGLANAMGYISIILSIAFTVYFFKKLSVARQHMD